MEMTIEDAILCLKGIKQYGSDTFTKRSQGDWQNSLDLAIDTIRKYQKIEEIVNNWHHDIEAKDFECMAEIADVVEDSNDDFVKEHKHERFRLG